jgi:hypothetical protein
MQRASKRVLTFVIPIRQPAGYTYTGITVRQVDVSPLEVWVETHGIKSLPGPVWRAFSQQRGHQNPPPRAGVSVPNVFN